MRASCPGPQLSPGPNSPEEGEAEVAADIHSQLIDLLVQLPPLALNDVAALVSRGSRMDTSQNVHLSENCITRGPLSALMV